MYKKLTIKVPKGETTEGINKALTPDDKPITERIKTFEDAVMELGDEHPLVTEYKLIAGTFDITNDLLAYLKLRIICEALNKGWKPTFNDGEYRYHPWFYVYTKEEYEKFDEEEKTYCVPLRSYNNVNANGGLVYMHVFPAGSNSYLKFSIRLTLKTRELAEYCGKQFMDIWINYLFDSNI